MCYKVGITSSERLSEMHAIDGTVNVINSFRLFRRDEIKIVIQRLIESGTQPILFIDAQKEGQVLLGRVSFIVYFSLWIRV